MNACREPLKPSLPVVLMRRVNVTPCRMNLPAEVFPCGLDFLLGYKLKEAVRRQHKVHPVRYEFCGRRGLHRPAASVLRS